MPTFLFAWAQEATCTAAFSNLLYTQETKIFVTQCSDIEIPTPGSFFLPCSGELFFFLSPEVTEYQQLSAEYYEYQILRDLI